MGTGTGPGFRLNGEVDGFRSDYNLSEILTDCPVNITSRTPSKVKCHARTRHSFEFWS